MTDAHLTDDDIRRLLDAVAHDPACRHPDRAGLRDAVLSEFRTASVETRPESAEATGADAEIVPIDPAASHLGAAGRPGLGWPRLSLAVAAAVALAIVSAVGLQRSSSQSVEAADGDVPLLVAPDGGEPEAVDPGRYLVRGIGGGNGEGIVLTLPDDVAVVDAGPRFVELRPVDDEWGSSLFIMTADGSLEELIAGYEDDGLVSVIRAVGTAGGDLIPEFEVRPTADARSERCLADPDCLSIGVTRFDHDGVNFARQIDGPDGGTLWTLYRSDTAFAPFQREANGILEGIQFAEAG